MPPFWIEGSLLILTIGLLLAPSTLEVELPETVAVEAHEVSNDARRGMLSDPPVVFLNSYDRDCMDCHRIFKRAGVRRADLFQHQEIVLDHGMNDRCIDCHAKEDRNKLRGQGSELIAFTESQTLCARCHGTTYRDWELGMHGRATGSWDTQDARRSKLSCVECHDPHHPAYESYTPLPGPATRGIDPDAEAGTHEGPVNPLRLAPTTEELSHE